MLRASGYRRLVAVVASENSLRRSSARASRSAGYRRVAVQHGLASGSVRGGTTRAADPVSPPLSFAGSTGTTSPRQTRRRTPSTSGGRWRSVLYGRLKVENRLPQSSSGPGMKTDPSPRRPSRRTTFLLRTRVGSALWLDRSPSAATGGGASTPG